jgi:hypothetical protein
MLRKRHKEGAALIGVRIAVIAGFAAGGANTKAKRARLDYTRTKALVPSARKAAWPRASEAFA